MRKHLWTSIAFVAVLGACSSRESSSDGSAGSSAQSGATNGGATNGGAAGSLPGVAGTEVNQAGASVGGAANAGAANAGAANGGAKNGGAAGTGGVKNGGAANGGAKNGGAAGANASGAGGNSAGAAAGTGGAAPGGCTSSTAGYKLVWSDEFNGAMGTAVDSTKWTFDVGGNGWGNNELEYYTSGTSNAAMDGAGNLVITAKQESKDGKNYTSARLKTQGLKTFTYGRIEARMKISQGQGLWPAFWMLGNDIGSNPWPACGEIDIMENVGKEPNIIHATVHGPGYSAGAGPTKQYTLPAPVASAFHVFAIEWELNTIRWYVDDTLYSTKTPSDIPSGATWVYAHPFFIIMNLAVGGGWPGNPDATTTFPQQLQVDYVRVCQK
ncbi:MAG TPA: glycoside hydrolase family 16 protein [Polyangiaceae bacterium]|nr:glycoside hydrolase family 16 protein [Polyangiaceae bacterium]